MYLFVIVVFRSTFMRGIKLTLLKKRKKPTNLLYMCNTVFNMHILRINQIKQVGKNSAVRIHIL